ncbi:BTB/POZ domain-containing protein [Candidatus Bathyarchaeota archaeon]|nr:BTB/POZ domain-containing protein [Candidatus Bathyarchaeota archaeon]
MSFSINGSKHANFAFARRKPYSGPPALYIPEARPHPELQQPTWKACHRSKSSPPDQPAAKRLATNRLPSAAASEHFTFVVGTSKRKFSIHSAIVAHQSRALSTLVNGDFKEAVYRCVEWDDIDEHTFHSFWQYAYSGDYDVPDDLYFERQLATGASEQGKSGFEFPVPPVIDEHGFINTNHTRRRKQERMRQSGFGFPGSSPESPKPDRALGQLSDRVAG